MNLYNNLYNDVKRLSLEAIHFGFNVIQGTASCTKIIGTTALAGASAACIFDTISHATKTYSPIHSTNICEIILPLWANLHVNMMEVSCNEEMLSPKNVDMVWNATPAAAAALTVATIACYVITNKVEQGASYFAHRFDPNTPRPPLQTAPHNTTSELQMFGADSGEY